MSVVPDKPEIPEFTPLQQSDEEIKNRYLYVPLENIPSKYVEEASKLSAPYNTNPELIAKQARLLWGEDDLKRSKRYNREMFLRNLVRNPRTATGDVPKLPKGFEYDPELDQVRSRFYDRKSNVEDADPDLPFEIQELSADRRETFKRLSKPVFRELIDPKWYSMGLTLQEMKKQKVMTVAKPEEIGFLVAAELAWPGIIGAIYSADTETNEKLRKDLKLDLFSRLLPYTKNLTDKSKLSEPLSKITSDLVDVVGISNRKRRLKELSKVVEKWDLKTLDQILSKGYGKRWGKESRSGVEEFTSAGSNFINNSITGLMLLLGRTTGALDDKELRWGSKGFRNWKQDSKSETKLGLFGDGIANVAGAITLSGASSAASSGARISTLFGLLETEETLEEIDDYEMQTGNQVPIEEKLGIAGATFAATYYTEKFSWSFLSKVPKLGTLSASLRQGLASKGILGVTAGALFRGLEVQTAEVTTETIQAGVKEPIRSLYKGEINPDEWFYETFVGQEDIFWQTLPMALLGFVSGAKSNLEIARFAETWDISGEQASRVLDYIEKATRKAKEGDRPKAAEEALYEGLVKEKGKEAVLERMKSQLFMETQEKQVRESIGEKSVREIKEQEEGGKVRLVDLKQIEKTKGSKPETQVIKLDVDPRFWEDLRKEGLREYRPQPMNQPSSIRASLDFNIPEKVSTEVQRVLGSLAMPSKKRISSEMEKLKNCLLSTVKSFDSDNTNETLFGVIIGALSVATSTQVDNILQDSGFDTRGENLGGMSYREYLDKMNRKIKQLPMHEAAESTSFEGLSPEEVQSRKLKISTTLSEEGYAVSDNLVRASLGVVSQTEEVVADLFTDLAKSIGREVLWYRRENDNNSGFVDSRDSAFIFLNVESRDSIPYLFAHELFHSISHLDPSLASKLKDFLKENYKNEMRQAWENYGRGRDLDFTETEATEEASAELFAVVFTRGKLWEKAKKSDVGKAVIRVGKRMINEMLRLYGHSDSLFKAFDEHGESVLSENVKSILNSLDLNFEDLSRVRGASVYDNPISIDEYFSIPASGRNYKTQGAVESLRYAFEAKPEGFVKKLAREIGSYVDFLTDIRGTPAGDEFIKLATEVEIRSRMLAGPYINRLTKLVKRTPKKTLKWLETFDEDGITNYVKMIEQDLSPIDAYAERWKKMHNRMMKELGTISENMRIYQERRGKVVPFIKAENGRVPRLMTTEGLDILQRKGSKLYTALLTKVQEMNPEMTLTSISKMIAPSKVHEGAPTGKLGMLEVGRRIPNFPAVIKSPTTGRNIKILRTSPSVLFESAADRQARRIANVEYFGQGKLKSATKGEVARVIKVLNPKAKTKLSKSRLQENVLEMVGDWLGRDYVLALNLKKLKKLAKIVGVPTTTMTKQNLMEILENEILKYMVGEKELSEDVMKGLKREARKVKGVNPGLEGRDFLMDFYERLSEDLTDVAGDLRKRFIQEGRNYKDFDRVLTFLRGGQPYETGVGYAYRSWRALSSIIGSLQISAAAIPNVFQPLLVVPYVGVGRFAKALKQVFRPTSSKTEGWKNIVSRAQALGALRTLGVASKFETTYTMTSFQHAIRERIAWATTLRFQLQKNNVITAAAGMILADDWKVNGISELEIPTARDLDLTQEEIDAVNSGEMSDQTYAKIVQRLVDKTQFITEATWRQGKLTQNPLLREIFPYRSYSSGQARRVMQLFRGLREDINALKRGDENYNYKQLAGRIKTYLSTVFSYVGAGMGTQILREALGKKRDKDEEETPLEEVFDRALNGFIEVQFLGPATRWITLEDQYNNTTAEVIASAIPKVNAVATLVAIPWNMLMQKLDYSTYNTDGELPLSAQSEKWVRRNFGALRRVWNIIEDFAYPDFKEWKEFRRKSRKWEEKYLKKRSFGVGKINPELYEVKEALIRGDKSAYVRAVREFWKERREAAEKTGKELDLSGDRLKAYIIGEMREDAQGLSSSLKTLDPVAVSKKYQVPFYLSLSEEDQKRLTNLRLRFYRRLWEFQASANKQMGEDLE